MNTLGQQQRVFTRLLAKLIQHAYGTGYELSLGEAYRTDEQAEINAMGPVLRERAADILAGSYPMLATKIRNNPKITGARQSLHQQRLAIDLNLFRSGIYLDASIAYKPLGDYWKTLHPDACWGGDFKDADGNHFSLTFGGLK